METTNIQVGVMFFVPTRRSSLSFCASLLVDGMPQQRMGAWREGAMVAFLDWIKLRRTMLRRCQAFPPLLESLQAALAMNRSSSCTKYFVLNACRNHQSSAFGAFFVCRLGWTIAPSLIPLARTAKESSTRLSHIVQVGKYTFEARGGNISEVGAFS